MDNSTMKNLLFIILFSRKASKKMGKKNKIKGKDNSKKQPNEKNNQQKKRPNTNEGPKNTKKQKLEEKLEIVLKFENYFTKKSQDNRCLTIRDIQNFVLWGYNLTSSPQWVEVKVQQNLFHYSTTSFNLFTNQ